LWLKDSKPTFLCNEVRERAMSQASLVFVVSVLVYGLPVGGRLLGTPAKAATLGDHSARVTSVPHSAPASAKPAAAAVAKPKVMAKSKVEAVHTNHSVTAHKHHAKKNFTDMEQLESLKVAFEAIKNLKDDFTAEPKASGGTKGMQELAEGSLSTEMHKKDSKIWTTIQQMLTETTGAMSKMTNATASGKKSIMHDLESSINASADTLKAVTEDAGKKQDQKSDEYLVGLLNQHRSDWSMEKQLNVTKKFSSSPAAQELLKHYNMKEPFATQLARLMDSTPPASKSKAKKAAKLFLQLADVIQDMHE